MYRFIFSIATFYNSFLRTNFTKKSPASELTELNISNLLWLLVVDKALRGHGFEFGARLSVVGKRIDGNTATRRENACYFDVFRLHQGDEVFHNNIDTIFVKCAMIAKAEQVEFQTFAFYHFHRWQIANANFSKIGLPRNRAQAGKFGTVEPHPIVVVGMFVIERLEHFGRIGLFVLGFATEQTQLIV